MRVIKLLLLVALLIVPISSIAKEANATTLKIEKKSQESNESKDGLKAASELFKAMQLEKIYAKIVDDTTKSFIARAPQLKSVKSKIHSFYEKYIGWKAIKDDMAKIYAKYYSVKDLEELTKFYKTELGQKTLKMLPKISAEGRNLAMKRVMKHQKELQEIVQKALKPKDSKKEAKK